MKERLLTGGCFDILHDSHREWLKIVASRASEIRFALAGDSDIAIRKGKDRPLFPYEWRKGDVEAFLKTLGVPYEIYRQGEREGFKAEGFRFVAPREEYLHIPNCLYIPEVGGQHTSDIYKALMDAKGGSTCEARQVGAVLVSPDGRLQGKASNGPPIDRLGECQKYNAYEKRYGSDKTI